MARANQSEIGSIVGSALTTSGSGLSSNKPLYARLAAALRAAIEDRDLLPGTRLPPERSLAAELRVARSTVAMAYDALRRQNLVDRRQGSGTVVNGGDLAHVSDRAASLAGSSQRNMIFRSLAQPDDGAIEFVSALAPASALVGEVLETAVRDLKLDQLTRHHGYFPLGYGPLRHAIADRFRERGVPTEDDEVLITSGAQQAITLAASCCVVPQQAVVLEDPTYPGAIDAFRAVGARLVAVPVQRTADEARRLTATLKRGDIRAVYLVPTFHNPTGRLMNEDARRTIAGLADTSDTIVIEDESLAELNFGNEVPPPIAAYSSSGAVITVGSMSKLFWGGLRVGWIRASPPTIAHLGRVKALSDLGTSVLTQAIAQRLLAAVERVRRARQHELQERLALMGQLLHDLLPSWRWTAPQGGVSLWINLPGGSSRDFARVAAHHGVTIVPGSTMSPTNGCDECLRLPFSNELDVLEDGIRRLARAWKAYSDSATQKPLEIIV